jgi:hypothetical protein
MPPVVSIIQRLPRRSTAVAWNQQSLRDLHDVQEKTRVAENDPVWTTAWYFAKMPDESIFEKWSATDAAVTRRT